MSVDEELETVPKLIRSHDFLRVLDILDRLTDKYSPHLVHPDWYFYGGTAAYFAARFQDARDWYHVALRLDPDHVEAMSNLAYIYACCPDAKFHDGRLGVVLANRVCDLRKGTDWRSLLTLAAAHARNADFGAAQACVAKADLTVSSTQRWRVERLAEHIRCRIPFTATIEDDLKKYDVDWDEDFPEIAPDRPDDK
jgi:hypothetical protein